MMDWDAYFEYCRKVWREAAERDGGLMCSWALSQALAQEDRAADYTGPRDAVHERVKDLLNGRIGQATRDQIGRALSTSKPAPEPKSIPRGALRFGR